MGKLCKSEIYFNDKDTKLYIDAADAPESAPIDKWTTRTIALSDMTITDDQKSATSFKLGAGISIGTGNYYMDNIMLQEKGTGIMHSVIKTIKVLVQNSTLLLGSEEVSDVEIYDIKGTPCMTVNNVSSVDIAGLAKGIYIVKVKSAGKSYVTKIVK